MSTYSWYVTGSAYLVTCMLYEWHTWFMSTVERTCPIAIRVHNKEGNR